MLRWTKFSLARTLANPCEVWHYTCIIPAVHKNDYVPAQQTAQGKHKPQNNKQKHIQNNTNNTQDTNKHIHYTQMQQNTELKA